MTIFNRFLQVKNYFNNSVSKQDNFLSRFCDIGVDAPGDLLDQIRAQRWTDEYSASSSEIDGAWTVTKEAGSSSCVLKWLHSDDTLEQVSIDLATLSFANPLGFTSDPSLSLSDILEEFTTSRDLNVAIGVITDNFLSADNISTNDAYEAINSNIQDENLRSEFCSRIAAASNEGRLTKVSFLGILQSIMTPVKAAADRGSFQVVTDSPFKFSSFMSGVVEVVLEIIGDIALAISKTVGAIIKVVTVVLNVILKLVNAAVSTEISIDGNADNMYVKGAIQSETGFTLPDASDDGVDFNSLNDIASDAVLCSRVGGLESCLWRTGGQTLGFNTFLNLEFNAKKWFENLFDPDHITYGHYTVSGDSVEHRCITSFAGLAHVDYVTSSGSSYEHVVEGTNLHSRIGFSLPILKLSGGMQVEDSKGAELYSALLGLDPYYSQYLYTDEEIAELHSSAAKLSEAYKYNCLLASWAHLFIAEYCWDEPGEHAYSFNGPCWYDVYSVGTTTGYGDSTAGASDSDPSYLLNIMMHAFAYQNDDFSNLGQDSPYLNLPARSFARFSKLVFTSYVNEGQCKNYLLRLRKQTAAIVSDASSSVITNFKLQYVHDSMNDAYMHGSLVPCFVSAEEYWRQASGEGRDNQRWTHPGCFFAFDEGQQYHGPVMFCLSRQINDDAPFDAQWLPQAYPYSRDFLCPPTPAVTLPDISLGALIAGIAVIVVATAAIFVAGKMISKRVEIHKNKKRFQRTNALNQMKENAVNAADPAEQERLTNEYAKAVTSYNRKARLFNWGQYDAGNGWIDPAGSSANSNTAATSNSTSLFKSNMENGLSIDQLIRLISV